MAGSSIFVYIYDETGTNNIYTNTDMYVGSDTIGELLANSNVVALGITKLATRVGGAALSSSTTFTEISPFGDVSLYDVSSYALRKLVINGAEYSLPEGKTYTAGTNIQISNSNVISATDTTYTAGTGISISNGAISNTGIVSTEVNDTAYASSWDGVTTTAPSKNAVYDKINAMDTTISNKANTSDVLTKTNTTEFTPTGYYQPATKKYVDDNISAATGGAVSDEAYGASWDGVTGIAPSKNTVYDKISSMDTAISGKQAQHSSIAVTLTSSGWSSNTQTVTAIGVTASNTVIVSPAPSSFTDYGTAQIYASAQASNSLTFTCGTEPTSDITVNVAILD